MAERTYLAVDMGASSGRVIAGVFDGERIALREVYRFENGPVVAAGHMHWDLLGIWSHILRGLQAAAESYRDTVLSVGVDTWGVDFGLLGRGDVLLGNPYHYRDHRTQGIFEYAFQAVSREEIFAETGLQFMELNALYQLLAMKREDSPLLDVAESLLLMPDLFHWLLTGTKGNERTDASTTQIYNPRTRAWSASLLERLGLPSHILGTLLDPGTNLGRLLPRVASATGLSRVEVVLPAAHDTASAVMAVPVVHEAHPHSRWRGQLDWCYISTGTWALMGVEVPEPVINDDCARLNFTNEAGVGGTTRLLKNICGLWILQECRRVWRNDGRDYSWDDLHRMAAEAQPFASIVEPDYPEFVAPERMPEAIRQACRRWGESVPESDGAVVRCVLESLALRCRQVLGWLERITGNSLRTIHMIGGGTQNRLLCQMTSDACGRQVLAGPVEATAIGNLMMQAITAGDVASIEEARAVVGRSFEVHRYEPQDTAAWDEAFDRFSALSSQA